MRTYARDKLLPKLASYFSIKQVFIVSFMIQFILAAGIMAFLIIRGEQNAVHGVLKEMRQEVLERVHEQLKDHMKEPVQLNYLNVNAWNAGLLNLSDPDLRDRYFANQIKAFPEAAMTFIGLSDGSFYGARRKGTGEIQIVRNNSETGGDSWYYAINEQGSATHRQEIFRRFDPRSRPWYESAQRIGQPTFSGVYRHFVFREPTVTAAHPLYDTNGRLAGVFGVDYLLSWLGDTLRGIPVGASGQIFITDADGYLVAASSLPELFEEKEGQFERIQAINATQPILKLAAQSFLVADEDNFREFSYAGHSYFVDRKAFREDGIDWKIYVVLAGDDFLGEFNTAIYWTAVGVGLFVVFAFMMAIWTAGWITKPILRLNAAARDLAAGRLQAVPPDTERQDELGQLSRSFNVMANKITDLVESLESRVLERTRALQEKTAEEQRLRELLHAELAKAGREQRAMLPPDLNHPQLSIRIVYEPNMLVSGDFCGYQWMSGGDILFGYLIDVTGHGAATALQTAAINVMIHETLQTGGSLPEIIEELNQRVGSFLKEGTFVAAGCFELDVKKKELRYIAAGITEFFADSVSIKGRIKTPGLFLGVYEQLKNEVVHLPLQDGDVICFYSDGIADKLADNSELPLNVEFDEFMLVVKDLAAAGAKYDDTTALCIKIGHL